MKPRMQRISYFMAYESVDGKNKGHMTMTESIPEGASNNPDEVIREMTEFLKEEKNLDVYVTAFNRI
jgi:hypothetical protein